MAYIETWIHCENEYHPICHVDDGVSEEVQAAHDKVKELFKELGKDGIHVFVKCDKPHVWNPLQNLDRKYVVCDEHTSP